MSARGAESRRRARPGHGRSPRLSAGRAHRGPRSWRPGDACQLPRLSEARTSWEKRGRESKCEPWPLFPRSTSRATCSVEIPVSTGCDARISCSWNFHSTIGKRLFSHGQFWLPSALTSISPNITGPSCAAAVEKSELAREPQTRKKSPTPAFKSCH